MCGGGVQLSDGRWRDGMFAKEGNQGMFFLSYLLLSGGRWNHAVGGRHPAPRAARRRASCLDVKFYRLCERRSCDSMLRGVSDVSEGPR